ncbi:unnamed protein product [Parnassius apollo]|uniref:(apollo) hypothetical protein n=1 Tax=Parnassius apollo TaxID=110799 RepID=A0A8S3WR49_PARAO|nr:unnamed protein product [Parnassius apollo]
MVVSRRKTKINVECKVLTALSFYATERQAIINGFSNKYGFPGCLGWIDSTHVAMIRPTEHEERFFNRKHYHSRSVQIINM